jgi:outer membrane receptor for ferrienterochelin and colicin
MKHRPIAQILAALILVLAAGPAMADDEIDEIVVTADFRERTTYEMATSVTVLSGDYIREAAQQHFEELVNAVPNLNWSGDGHRARYFQIRG